MARRGVEVGGDGIGETFPVLVGGLQLSGAHDDAFLQLIVELEFLFGPLSLGDVAVDVEDDCRLAAFLAIEDPAGWRRRSEPIAARMNQFSLPRSVACQAASRSASDTGNRVPKRS